MKIILTAVLLVFLLVQPVLAYAGEPPVQSTPVLEQTAGQTDGIPWLGVLVFLVPLGIVLYRSRGKKAPDIKAKT